MPEPIRSVEMRAVPDGAGTLEITVVSMDGRRFQTRVTGERFTPVQAERLFLAFNALMCAAVARHPPLVSALEVF